MLGASYKTKKELKENIGKPLRYVETSIFGSEYKPAGTFCVVGPSPRRVWFAARRGWRWPSPKRVWFAEVTMQNDVIVKVR